MSLKQNLHIAVLCRVIDNFGDIGVAYRLSRSLLELAVDGMGASATGKNLRLSLIVDDLDAFSRIAPCIKRNTFMQNYCGINVCYSPTWDKVVGAQNVACGDGAQDGVQKDSVQDWSARFTEYFFKQKIDVIIECFACGRPFWLENIIFATQNPTQKNCTGRVYNILNLEYLTAEEYAEDFHLQRALTRSACVKKYFFMPGLSAKTGGLILDKAFMSALATCKKNNTILFFAYNRDFAPIISALNKSLCTKNSCGAPCEQVKNSEQVINGAQGTKVLVARGASQAPFLDACKKHNAKFCLDALPFLHQLEWDAMLCTCSFLFVRGEDSLSRALLLGVPFVWHAYPQSQEHQLVKVESFLRFLKPYFTNEHFNLIADVWRLYNKDELLQKEADELSEKLCIMIKMRDELEPSFKKSAKEIAKNGNLALQVMTFIAKIV